MLRQLIILAVFLLHGTWALGSCGALSLTADKAYNCGPGLFRFQLKGATNAKQIIWNFGDGEKIAPDSIYQYLFKTGKVDVQVKVIWPNNTRCDTVFREIVEIRALPIPKIDISKNILCNGPEKVSFTCLNAGFKSISWIVDGTNYYDEGNKITHQFVTAGHKGLNVIFIDTFGCRGIADLKDTIHIYNKVNALITANDSQGCAPKQIQIQASIQLNGEKVNKLKWKVDGQTPDSFETLLLPQLTFENTGEFDVRLYLETSKGCQFEFFKHKMIKIGDSVPIQLSKPKPFYCFNERIIISDLVDKTGGEYSWECPSTASIESDSTKNFIIFKIKEEGAYKVNVAYARNGCITKAWMTDSIKIKRIKADFTSANNFHCQAPLDVDFKNLTQATDTGEISYQWIIYKANSQTIVNYSNIKNPSFRFDQLGNYDVKLIAKHKLNGCVDTLLKQSFVRIDTIRPQMAIVPRIACVNQEVKCFNTTPNSTYKEKDTVYWVLTDLSNNNILKTSDSSVMSHVFSRSGLYKVSLFAGNKTGCPYSASVHDTIEIIIPTLKRIIAPQHACSGNTVQLTGATEPKKAFFTHYWEVIDADSSYKFSTHDTSIRLYKPGLYDLKYAIQLGEGCRDSLITPNAIGINGIGANIELDTSSGCLPFTVKAKAVQIQNFHYGNADDKVTYRWTSTPSKGVVFSDTTSRNTQVVFNEIGFYTLNLKLTNSTGCDSTIISDTIYAGVDARFVLNDYRVCIGDEIIATTTSKLKPSSYTWKVLDSKVNLLSKNDSTMRFSTQIEGRYFITLVAEKNGICFDTFTVGFEAIEVKAAFESLDTLLTCAPVYAQFLSKSKNADRLIWDFGDGQQFVTTLPSSGHVYLVNSGWSKGFDVTLQAESNEGCADISEKKNFVWVLGPVPKIELINHKGCEPLEVEIINKSTDVVRYIADFGDNSAQDSSVMATKHNYSITQVDTDTQTYVMRLFAYDSMGCLAKFEPFDLVEVYKKPEVKFSIDSGNRCNPAKINFVDLTPKGQSRLWQLNLSNYQLLDSLKAWEVWIQDEGVFPISLQAKNYMNCYAIATDSIEIYPKVTTNIQDPDSACFNQLLQFKANVASNANNLNCTWIHSQNGIEIGKALGYNANFNMSQIGFNKVSLISSNEYNCADTAFVEVYVPDPQKSDIPIIKYVSTNEQNYIELATYKSKNNRFYQYQLSNKGVHIDSSRQIRDTFWETNIKNVQNDLACMELIEEDICGYSKKSTTHCPVLLSTSSKQNFEVELVWSAYRGWHDLLSYDIYRSLNNADFILLDNVPAQTLQYTDSPLCPGTYSYRIAASNAREYTSFSNIATIVPKYESLTQKLNVRDIQVIDNQSLQIRWDHSTHARHQHYQLNKWQINGNEIIKREALKLSHNSFIDKEVNPHKFVYKYTVQDVDICDQSVASGLQGRSILLSGKYIENISDLNWTPYVEWEQGVAQYIVHINKNEKPQSLKSVEGSTLNYMDAEIHEDIKGDYCYVVMSTPFFNNRDTSISNTVCLYGPSKIYIPNSFTPNNDGKNDLFRPVVYFIQDIAQNNFQRFEFTVFNRWGEILFTTNDLESGWDGQYNNQKCQQGVYGFKLQVYGLDGVMYFKSGTVNLLR